jgi:hypothetical protein
LFVSTPFDALAGQVDSTGTADLLVSLTNQFASYVDTLTPALYLSLLPEPHLLDEAELHRLARLASAGTFAAVLGPGVPAEPGHGVRGIGRRREPLPRDEWAAITLGPNLSAAVLARRTPEGDDEWMYAITYDPLRVVAAARSLVRLLGPAEPRYDYLT